MRASRYLLGFDPPLREIHLFMDASAQRHGGGHYLVRHDLRMMTFMSRYYNEMNPELGRQARLEVAVHIALDKGYVTPTDCSLMSDFWRIIHRRGGRRGILGTKKKADLPGPGNS